MPRQPPKKKVPMLDLCQVSGDEDEDPQASQQLEDYAGFSDDEAEVESVQDVDEDEDGSDPEDEPSTPVRRNKSRLPEKPVKKTAGASRTRTAQGSKPNLAKSAPVKRTGSEMGGPVRKRKLEYGEEDANSSVSARSKVQEVSKVTDFTEEKSTYPPQKFKFGKNWDIVWGKVTVPKSLLKGKDSFEYDAFTLRVTREIESKGGKKKKEEASKFSVPMRYTPVLQKIFTMMMVNAEQDPYVPSNYTKDMF